MANTDVDPNLDPYSQEPVSPRAQSALSGGDEDAEDRAYRRQRRREFDELFREQRETSAREQEQRKQRAAEMAPREKAVEEQTQSLLQTSERERNRLTTRQEDVPAFDPNAAKGDAMAWMSLAAGFGAIAGGLSRYHTTAALNAFSGMMNGFAKGQLQVYEQKRDEWNAAADRVHELNARAQRDYKAIMDDAKLNLDAKSNLMEMTANKWQDNLMATQAQQRSIERMTQLMNARENFDQNMQFRREQSTKHDEQFYQKIDAELAKSGRRRNPDTGAIERDPNAVATGQTWQKDAYQDWKAEYIQREGHPPSAEEERQFGRTLQVVRSPQAMALQKFQEENPKATSKDYVAFAANLAGDTAAIRASGNRAGQIAVSADEADSTFTLAKQASSGWPRGSYRPLNQLYQDAALVKSDKRYRTFMAANEAAVTAYGATMSRSGANTVSAQTRAHEVLDTADSDATYKAGLDQLQKEVNEVRKAPARARADLMRSLGLVVDQPDKTDEAPPATTSNASTLSDDELRHKLGLP